jgi:hypothetical protein
MKRLVALVAVLSLVLLSVTAFGRPGGGQSFSGGSRSGSSTSGGSRSFGGSSSSSSGSSRSFGGSSTSSSGSSRSTSSTSTSSGSSWSSTSSGSSYTGSTTSSSGSSYSSSPPSYYADSGGSSHKFLWFLLGLGILLFVFWGYGKYKQGRDQEWVARAQAEARIEAARQRRWASIAEALAGLRAADDGFSFVLFEDFLYALYAEAHFARGKQGGLESLGAYLSAGARQKLAYISNAEVTAVVIGGMKVVDIITMSNEPFVYVTVVFTTNVSERASGGGEAAFYLEERWSLKRSTLVKSRPPQRARTIDCPNCGAPRDKTVGGKCGYCGAAPTEGASDWYVDDVTVLHREARGPMLTGTTEEVGTDLPTVVAPDVNAHLAALQREDPTFVWPAFLARIERAFAAFHASWSAQDLTAVRPYLTDNLFELQRYWVSTYQAQRLRNVTEGARIVTIHLARITRDKWFHAITVRVFASCLDYTLDANNAIVGGTRDKTRDYSEYWTFVRGVGTKGTPRSDGACPSCGAPIGTINRPASAGRAARRSRAASSTGCSRASNKTKSTKPAADGRRPAVAPSAST